MVYNTSYLIAALICLVLIIFHYVSRRRVNNSSNRVFLFFIIIGTLDVFLDYICTLMMMEESPEYREIMAVLLTLLFFIQVMFPYGLYLYVRSLQNGDMGIKKLIGFNIIPTALMELMVLFNAYTGSIFCVSEQGEYIRGPFYNGVYLYALVFGVVILAGSLIHYKELGFRKVCVIWEFAGLMCASVVVQGLHNEMLTTGYGISLGMMILFLTLHHPSEYLDVLTRVFNIQGFLEWSREAFKRKKTFHVISVDLHQLKQVNTIFGTDAGDAFLKEIVGTLQAILNAPYIYRVSSKRMLMVTFTLAEYEKVRNRVAEYLKTDIMIHGEKFGLSAIICGITNANDLRDSDTLLSYITYLVSLANVNETTHVIQSSEQTYKGYRYSIEIEQYLRVAVEEDLFEVYYQPIYSLEKKKFVSVEALSRLRHPDYGRISPDIFIEIAERNGLISQLEYLQFRRICRFFSQHRELLEMIETIKFNLSPADLLNIDFAERFVNIIREYDLPFSCFQFEVTETMATEYNDKLYQMIDKATRYGIGLCLDDFGSGYANLDSVFKLPFSSIKLDRTLLNGLLTDEKKRIFYKNMTTLFKNMGYYVIAEGVEKEEELKLLEKWNVDMIQGYYFSKPLEEGAFLYLMKNERSH